MRKLAMVVAAIVSSVLVPVAVKAGYKQTNTVSTDGSTYMSGNLGDVRNSSDGTQYFGCDLYTYSSSGPYLFCFGRSASSVYFSCSSSDPKFITTVTTMTNASYIDIGADTSGNCTYLQISDYTYFRPMTP